MRVYPEPVIELERAGGSIIMRLAAEVTLLLDLDDAARLGVALLTLTSGLAGDSLDNPPGASR